MDSYIVPVVRCFRTGDDLEAAIVVSKVLRVRVKDVVY